MTRKVLLASTILTMAATAVHAQSLQSGSVGGMPYQLLPASGGCSTATPCSIVLYLSYMDETASATASDLQSYFGGAFAAANPHTIVVAPTIAQPQSESVSWGGYLPGTTPEEQQAVGVVQAIEQQYGASVNTHDVVVTGGSLGGDGTQSMLLQYGPHGETEQGVFSAGLSFDAALYADASSPATRTALCGVPLMAVHGTADTNQSVTYDEALASNLSGCSGFSLDLIQGAGHGTWSGPSGYSAGVGTGTPLGWLTLQLQAGASASAPATAAGQPAAVPVQTAPAMAADAAPAQPGATPAAASQPANCTLGSPGAVNGISNPSATGRFSTVNGQIIGPNGQPFIAKGINVYDSDMGDAAQILATFPGLNFIRLNVYSYQPPAAYQAFIDTMSAAGVVVEVEDHTNSTGSDAGGATGTAFTGAELTNELNWYSSMASAYASNPDVWFGTDNEPPAAGLSNWEQQTYNAIRNAGNNSPILMEEPGGGGPGEEGVAGGLNPSVYATMNNIIWDVHYYGWVTDDSTDPSTVAAALTSEISAAQSISDASGTVPVIIGEYGISTDGQNADANGSQVVTAVTDSGVGSAAWNWASGAASDNLTSGGALTSYGQQVAAYIGATACPIVATTSNAVTTAASAGQQAVATANALSVAQVAQLAAEGETVTGQSIGNVASFAASSATGAAPGTTLATDPATAAVLSGTLTNAQPIVRTIDSPGGTMPVPAPAAGSTTVDVSGDYTAAAAGPGNGTGTISGTGNVVTATGGVEDLTVTGPGNTITTGPYDDTVTVQSAGNTINLGGGSNTLILAYNGQQPSGTVNADAPALPPLASAGNIIEAPAPGTGALTIRGVLASNDTIDLTQALAGTTWDHQASTMWQYVTAQASPSGCQILVGGQVIVSLPNGSPNGNIGPFITAH